MLGKNLTPLYYQRFEEKILHRQNHPYPFSKVKRSAFKLNPKNELIIN